MRTAHPPSERHSRSRWWRLPLWAVFVLAMIASVASGLLWLGHDQFEHAVASSNDRLAGRTTEQPGATIESWPATVLVAAPGGTIQGAALIRLNPQTHTLTTVELGGAVRLGSTTLGELVQRSDVATLETQMRRSGLAVDHVLLLDPGRLNQLVDALGGVSLFNPADFAGSDANGRPARFAVGEITLSGQAAGIYSSPDAGAPDAAELRQTTLLAAIGMSLLQPVAPLMERRVGSALRQYVATDLSAVAFATAVQARADTSRLVNCSDISGGAVASAATAALASSGPDPACRRASLGVPLATRLSAELGAQPGPVLAFSFGVFLSLFGLNWLALLISGGTFRALRTRRNETRAGNSEPSLDREPSPVPSASAGPSVPAVAARSSRPEPSTAPRPGPGLAPPRRHQRSRISEIAVGAPSFRMLSHRFSPGSSGRSAVTGYAAALTVAVVVGILLASALSH